MGCGCGGRSKASRRVAEIRRAAERARAASRQAVSKKNTPKPAAPQPPQVKPPQQRRVVRGRVARPVNAKPYVVKAGDTMTAIAQRNGMALKELLKFDGGTGVANLARLRSRNANVIKAGEMILIPSIGKKG